MSASITPDVLSIGDLSELAADSRSGIDSLVNMSESARLIADRDSLVRAIPDLLVRFSEDEDHYDEPSVERADEALSILFPKGATFAEIKATAHDEFPGIKCISLDLNNIEPEPPINSRHVQIEGKRSEESSPDSYDGWLNGEGGDEDGDEEYHDDDDEKQYYEYALIVLGPTIAAYISTSAGEYNDGDCGVTGSLNIYISLDSAQMQGLIREKAKLVPIEDLEEKLQQLFNQTYEPPADSTRRMKP